MNTVLIIKGKVPAKSSNRRIVWCWNKEKKIPRVISSESVLEYEKIFALQIPKHAKKNLGENSRLEVHIEVFTDSFRQDIDSFPKTILDNLQKCGVIKNDNKIDKLTVVRHKDTDCRVVINIGEL